MASSINIGVPEREDLSSRSYPDIGNYGVIGDCRSAALISKSGAIDWLCWPRFDSPAVFAALLDAAEGGHWTLAPVAPYRVARRYEGATNVLRTRFVAEAGAALLTDFMPVCSEEDKRGHAVPEH